MGGGIDQQTGRTIRGCTSSRPFCRRINESCNGWASSVLAIISEDRQTLNNWSPVVGLGNFAAATAMLPRNWLAQAVLKIDQLCSDIPSSGQKRLDMVSIIVKVMESITKYFIVIVLLCMEGKCQQNCLKSMSIESEGKMLVWNATRQVNLDIKFNHLGTFLCRPLNLKLKKKGIAGNFLKISYKNGNSTKSRSKSMPRSQMPGTSSSTSQVQSTSAMTKVPSEMATSQSSIGWGKGLGIGLTKLDNDTLPEFKN
uniref:Uncharacterized protein n=1 Tax=Romanomermis culicivorax TaxID=13658 RepID=A0A915JD72_ROMCU